VRTINLSHEKAHHIHQGIIVITSNSINQDQTSMSRSLPPTEGPNLGTSVPSPCMFAIKPTYARLPQNPSPQFMDIVVFTPCQGRHQETRN
jgi:hypothetical protein